MKGNTKLLLIKLEAARDRNEISDQEYAAQLRSILEDWTKSRFQTKKNTRSTYAGSWTWSAVIRESSLFLIAISVLLLIARFWIEDHEISTKDWSYCDALEEIKCQNGGFLVKTDGIFTCQCSRNYYGERCAHERYFSTVSRLIGSALFDGVNENMRRGAPKTWWWWSLSPFTNDSPARLRKTIISFHQDQLKRMIADDGFAAKSGERDAATDPSRILPPGRPLYCPVDASLPPLSTLYDQVFKREYDGRLKQDPKRRNVLFHTFYQYFMLQFFGKGSGSTVTGSQLYGSDEAAERALRSMKDGKLKTEYLDGEHYPSRLSFAEKIKKFFTRTPMVDQVHWFNRAVTAANSRKPRNGLRSVFDDVYEDVVRTQWAVANPMVSADPLLFATSTLWVREHNRVCDQLRSRRPDWEDDRLYAVARRTVVGQMMGIVMNDLLPATSPFAPLKHDPESYAAAAADWSSLNAANGSLTTMPLEMLLTTILPSGLPANKYYVRNKRQALLANGMSEMVRLMVEQKMGMLTNNNDGVATMPLTKLLIKLSRENKVKSFNDYRRHFGLHAYESFYELTGNHETANKLASLYGDVENVELLTGMLTEKRSDDVVPTFTVMINSFIINSIVTNPLYGKDMWKEDTFGGEYGFDLVMSANIKTFICNNLIDKCDDGFIVDIYTK